MARPIGRNVLALDAGKASLGAVTRGADRAKVDAAWDVAVSSTRPSEWQVAAENPQVRMLVRRISEAAEEAARLDAEIAALLAEEAMYGCLLSVPDIGPRTASELVISVDISDFPADASFERDLRIAVLLLVLHVAGGRKRHRVCQQQDGVHVFPHRRGEHARVHHDSVGRRLDANRTCPNLMDYCPIVPISVLFSPSPFP